MLFPRYAYFSSVPDGMNFTALKTMCGFPTKNDKYENLVIQLSVYSYHLSKKVLYKSHTIYPLKHLANYISFFFTVVDVTPNCFRFSCIYGVVVASGFKKVYKYTCFVMLESFLSFLCSYQLPMVIADKFSYEITVGYLNHRRKIIDR